jgi:hypothetical protein
LYSEDVNQGKQDSVQRKAVLVARNIWSPELFAQLYKIN